MDLKGIFLRGFLMGLCDLIPGVSGGTIAFITGIYERLIDAIEALFGRLHSRKKVRDKDIDAKFLGALALGIAAAILLGASAMGYLLENHAVAMLSFFLGLIAASSGVIYLETNDRCWENIAFGVVGALIGIGLVFIPQMSAQPSYEYIFLAGILAISAMLLPGISGAFVLFVMGVYGVMINVARNLPGQYPYAIVFLLGALFGAMFMSKAIAHLLRTKRNKTMYFLLGLVIGSLSVAAKRLSEAVPAWDYGIIAQIILFTVIGLITVFLIARLANRDSIKEKTVTPVS